MPRRNTQDTPPSPRWALVSLALTGGREPVAPVRAEWDEGEYAGRCFAYRNFRLERYEWAYGRIPQDRLGDYAPASITR